jgi:hypothetical protein
MKYYYLLKIKKFKYLKIMDDDFQLYKLFKTKICYRCKISLPFYSFNHRNKTCYDCLKKEKKTLKSNKNNTSPHSATKTIKLHSWYTS